MLLTILILCFSHLVLASPVPQEYDMEDIEQLKYHFNDYLAKYNKSYTAEEERLRFHYFKENLAIINDLNRRYNPITVFGINQFTDWSEKEKENLYGIDGTSLGDNACSVGVASDIKTGSLTDSIDWRDKNAVAPPQDQGTCGSCWAFSAVSVLEGAYALKHNTLLKLSEQQFVDCDSESSGCKSGTISSAISSTMQLGGQELESDYPYIGKQQQCQFDVNKAKVQATSCKIFNDIGDSDDKLANLLASTGPLAIQLDGKAHAFHNYHGGILIDCAGETLSHGVSLIGYGEENGVPYWIIKNSWGSSWGESGFVRVKRGVGCLLIGGFALTAEVA